MTRATKTTTVSIKQEIIVVAEIFNAQLQGL